MKVAFAIDQLVERDEVTRLLEIILPLFPEAPIYTLAHRSQQILGPLQMRVVHSSFLSHWVKSKKSLKRLSFLIPSALKDMPVSPEVECLIYFSSGWIQGLNFSGKKIIYLLQVDSLKGFFSAYLRSYQQKTFMISAQWLVSSYFLQEKFKSYFQSSVVYPAFASEDFQLQEFLPKSADHFLMINAQDIVAKCNGELFSLFQTAHVSIDLRLSFFPTFALTSLAMGVPVMVVDHPINREIFQVMEGVLFYQGEKTVQEMKEKWRIFDSRLLRRQALKFNERFFKVAIKSHIEKLTN